MGTALEPMETDEALYEFVNGQRAAMPEKSFRVARIVSRLGSRLYEFITPNQLGEFIFYLLVRLPLVEDPSRIRRPDISFISHSRMASFLDQDLDDVASDVVPDLAIDVTNPSDPAEDRRRKVLEYFRAGVRCVWVVYPELQIVDVYVSPTSVRVFGPDDTLVGDPILPGFQLRLADLFAPFRPL
jgi:Uma2 family endonuclease